MTDKYGSPDLGDATAYIEKTIEAAAQEVVRRIDSGSAAINREPGTKPVPPEQQVADFQMIRENPQELSKLIQTRAETMGPARALQWFHDWYTDMEGKAG